MAPAGALPWPLPELALRWQRDDGSDGLLGPPWGRGAGSPRPGAAVVNTDGCFSVIFYLKFKLHFETVAFLCL